MTKCIYESQPAQSRAILESRTCATRATTIPLATGSPKAGGVPSEACIRQGGVHFCEVTPLPAAALFCMWEPGVSPTFSEGPMKRVPDACATLTAPQVNRFLKLSADGFVKHGQSPEGPVRTFCLPAGRM